MATIYDFNLLDKKGNEVALSDYKGKVLLVVNSATACGFTPQYDELEALYERLNAQGLEILDIPCNQFGGQAAGTDEEISEFCSTKFGVKFPQFKKAEVNGENKLPSTLGSRAKRASKVSTLPTNSRPSSTRCLTKRIPHGARRPTLSGTSPSSSLTVKARSWLASNPPTTWPMLKSKSLTCSKQSVSRKLQKNRL